MDFFPYYWICEECAKDRGGEAPDEPLRSKKDICQYCNGLLQTEENVFPWIDYLWPHKSQ